MTSQEADRIIQDRWAARQIPLADALIFPEGKIVVVRSSADSQGSVVRRSVSRGAETTLASVLEKEPDPWFDLEPQCRIEDQAKSRRYLAGGGDMGNEGFIAAETWDGRLIWVLHFIRSNPFEDIRLDNDSVVAINNCDEEWIVPLHDPAAIRIVREGL